MLNLFTKKENNTYVRNTHDFFQYCVSSFFFFKGKKASTASRIVRVKKEKQHLFKIQKKVGINMKPTAVIVSENAVRGVVA